ncbi:prolipoprotein diacylglyceryl transferase [Phenylobacterium soli]|uniref:Phosphatidylglycerol--prolipoprotein diacylglyceryl transferase n=1 Tax=Phenylobacterium soli TaxID=2170551 RepID=A0A328AIF3_9CAUL|nr:prolipoprotein diacylglyceryl transferase [Phenylobacterium soli]RAK54295.1 prolipoprotein diacylglyceryl transferase [Phenylobacterium soli]
MPFPNFDPVLVHIGPIAIRWYALGYVAAILLGWRYAVSMIRNRRLWLNRPPPLTAEKMDDFILWATLGVIVGGRLGHVFFYTPELIWTDPVEILKTWHGGMSFHGGALGVLISGLIFCRVNRIDPLRLGDLVVAVEPIGGFFVRIANFINGELWGRPTHLPWGIVFPGAGPEPRHPSQLYEAALEGLALFLILRWGTHGRKLLNRRGVVLGMFAMGYGLIRISLENVREPDSYMPNFPFGLTMGMMLSAPMVLVGAWLIWRGLKEPLPPALADEEAHLAQDAQDTKTADEPA